jgi:hypothetical protein
MLVRRREFTGKGKPGGLGGATLTENTDGVYDGGRFSFTATREARYPGSGVFPKDRQEELSLEGNTLDANCSNNTQANEEAL